MTINKSREKPTDWTLCPVAGEIATQQQSLDLVIGELLHASEDSIDDLLVTARGLLSAAYQRTVSDDELAMYVDQTVWLICDPEAAEAHFRTPRHDSNGVYEAIVQAA